MTNAKPGLSLYMFAGCGYCRRVVRVIDELGIEVERRDILLHPEFRQELRREGGRGSVPCLRIERPGGKVEWLYESVLIIRYLRENIGYARNRHSPETR